VDLATAIHSLQPRLAVGLLVWLTASEPAQPHLSLMEDFELLNRLHR